MDTRKRQRIDAESSSPAAIGSPKLCKFEIGELIDGAHEALLSIADYLVESLADAEFEKPITYIYNPLVYAREPYEQYIRSYGGRRLEVLLVGMNPGPFGMAQTGIPFGDAIMVRDFLKINGMVGSPKLLHPKRPIHGFNCQRREVSGQRLWGWVKEKFHTPGNFFQRFWVYNYCPLMFMEASGKNRTPNQLKPAERKVINSICNHALSKTIELLQPILVVGIGQYAAKEIRKCVSTNVRVGEIMHPSPANPKANKEWASTIEMQLQSLGIRFDS